MSQDELKAVLTLHQMWLQGEEDGKRADFSRLNLSLCEMINADLRGADFRGADLQHALLTGANLRGARLDDANLFYADLRFANLSGTRFCNANLRKAQLENALINKTNFTFANLSDARISDGTGIPSLIAAELEIVPRLGSFEGWKRADYLGEKALVRLRIPEDAKRSNATGRKCRASKAEVLEIMNTVGLKLDYATSIFDRHFTYVVGKKIEVKDFDDNRWNECAPGIHFFLTREEAEAYC